MKRAVIGLAVLGAVLLSTQVATAGPSTGNPCKPVPHGKNRLVGTGHADHLCGGNVADVLIGKAGRDRLAGNHGSDLLRGGRGDDVLVPGKGRDRVLCGPGRDLVLTNFPSRGTYRNCERFRDPA